MVLPGERYWNRFSGGTSCPRFGGSKKNLAFFFSGHGLKLPNQLDSLPKVNLRTLGADP